MAMAERYPTDFNGIIAGAPEIIAGPLNAELQTWNDRVNSREHVDFGMPLSAALAAPCVSQTDSPGPARRW